jgi:hypothetical protein
VEKIKVVRLVSKRWLLGLVVHEWYGTVWGPVTFPRGWKKIKIGFKLGSKPNPTCTADTFILLLTYIFVLNPLKS